MPCPVDTTLQFAKICGSVQEICPVGDPQNLRVTIDLVNPEGGALTDPTTDAFVVGGRIFDDLIQDSTDGCWCTCDLLVNTAADPAQSLQPNNTAYKITVRWGTTTVIDGLQFQLDADTIGNFTLDTNAECGDCINISDLVEIPVLPPAATFCDQVDACVVDLQTQADGNTAAIAALVDSDTTNASAALTGDTTDGLTVTVTDSSGNPVTGNLPYADLCTLIQTCLPTDEDWTLVDDGAGTVTFTHPTDPQSPITITSDDDSSYEVAGDGTITITFDDGSVPLVIPPASDVGEATVTEPTDYTATIAAVDAAGTATTSTVLRRLDDCENNAIDPAASTFVTWEQLTAYTRGHHVAFVDSGDGCTPADITDCPSGLTAITTNPMGDVWEWSGAAWALRSVNPAGDLDLHYLVPPADYSVVDPNSAQNGAFGFVSSHDAVGLMTLPSPAVNVIGRVEHTITNDDCVPWDISVKGFASIQISQLGPGNYIVVQSSSGPNDTQNATPGFTNWFGTMVSSEDNRDSNGAGNEDLLANSHHNGNISTNGRLAVGDSVTLGLDVGIVRWAWDGPFATTPGTSSAVQFNNLVLEISRLRVKP